MTYRRDRIYQNHTRPHIPHHLPYPSPVIGRIAMYLAFAATPLVIPFWAMIQTRHGVFKQPAAISADIIPGIRRMMTPAISGDHKSYDPFLLFYASHNAFFKIFRMQSYA